MNEKQWRKRQDRIAHEQKKEAAQAKLAMLGVPPKPPKPPEDAWLFSAPPVFKVLPPSHTFEFPFNYTFELTFSTTWIDNGYSEFAKSLTFVAEQFSVGYQPSVVSQLFEICPGLTTTRSPCPEGDLGAVNLSSLIPHLNDNHRWTRERIADWLETLDVDLTVKPKIKEEMPSANDRTSETLTINEYADIGYVGQYIAWNDLYTGVATSGGAS